MNDVCWLEVAVGTRGNLDMVAVEDLGNGSHMAREVALGPLGDTASAPGDEHVLGQTGVGVLDLDIGELDSTLVEVLNKVG